MWPLRIENPTFLQTICGHHPDLSSVEITKAEISRDGPGLHLPIPSDRKSAADAVHCDEQPVQL